MENHISFHSSTTALNLALPLPQPVPVKMIAAPDGQEAPMIEIMTVVEVDVEVEVADVEVEVLEVEVVDVEVEVVEVEVGAVDVVEADVVDAVAVDAEVAVVVADSEMLIISFIILHLILLILAY